MGFLDKFKGNPFEKIKSDDITAERITLERDEKLVIMEVTRLSEQKRKLFEKGFKSSEAEKRALARQIQQIDQKMKLKNLQLKRASDQLRVLDNLAFIHENKQSLERAGLMSDILKLPKSKLDEFLARVNIADGVTAGNLDSLLNTMLAEAGITTDIEDDKETSELMDIWSTSDASQSDDVFQKWDKEKTSREGDLELE